MLNSEETLVKPAPLLSVSEHVLTLSALSLGALLGRALLVCHPRPTHDRSPLTRRLSPCDPRLPLSLTDTLSPSALTLSALTLHFPPSES